MSSFHSVDEETEAQRLHDWSQSKLPSDPKLHFLSTLPLHLGLQNGHRGTRLREPAT